MEKRLKMVEFNQKEIEIGTKALLTIQFWRWISNQTHIDDQIWTARNRNGRPKWPKLRIV